MEVRKNSSAGLSRAFTEPPLGQELVVTQSQRKETRKEIGKKGLPPKVGGDRSLVR